MITGSRQQLEGVSVAELSVADISVAPASTEVWCSNYKNMYRLLLYKKDQEILKIGFNQMFGSCTGNGARQLL